jgi:hypothetical protein
MSTPYNSCQTTTCQIPAQAYLPCRPRQFAEAVPFAFVPPLSVGRSYALPTPSYPIVRSPEQLFTPGPSYLNAVANDGDHPLKFMTFNNTQR